MQNRKASENIEGLAIIKPTADGKVINNKLQCNQFIAELSKVRSYLSVHTATATMTAKALDIYCPNLCRYKVELEKMGVLVVVNQQPCKETGRKVQFITTNPEIVKQVNGGTENDGRV